jgi:cytoskeletal protein RodZ
MPDTFGGRLREHREQRQVPLIAIAEATKINIALLEGLERDDVSRWPGGIFRRAFLRAYAGAIGLNADAIVREFQELHPDPLERLPLMGAETIEGNADATDDSSTGFWRVLGTSLRAVTRSRSSNGSGAISIPAAAPSREMTSDQITPAASDQDQSRLTNGASEEITMLASDPPDQPIDDAGPAQTGNSSGSESDPLRETKQSTTSREINWIEGAALCTQLAQAHGDIDAAPLLATVSRLLGANGIILWISDPQIGALSPALVHGYSPQIVSQLPLVRQDDDNATAAAFQEGRTCIVSGGNGSNGGMTLPVFGPAGCVGVLALEFTDGAEHNASIRALGAILAAQMGGLVEATRSGHVAVGARKRA